MLVEEVRLNKLETQMMRDQFALFWGARKAHHSAAPVLSKFAQKPAVLDVFYRVQSYVAL